MAAEVLGQRALNRTLLERQMLRRRCEVPAAEAIARLVGMQAQVPSNPYVGLWARLAGFRHEDLAGLIAGRRAVRMPLLRVTLHLVTADDCLALWPVMRGVLEASLWRSPFGKNLAGVDLEALVAAGRALMEERPRTNAELSKRLQALWPDREAASLAYATHYLMPVVQVPPRGIWGATGQPIWTTAAGWLGRPLAAEPSVDEMVMRYLAAFGPATAMDVRAWSGLTGMREVIARLRPRLRPFRDEQGRELFDVPEGLLPDPEEPVPPRFLPDYDNVLLGHADRTRIVSDEFRQRVGIGKAAVLVDGFARGAWAIERQGGAVTLVIDEFGALTARERQEVGEEGERLLAFVSGDATSRNVRFGSNAGS
jgi:hypothetical protein